jgi:antirestriction protein ArdC
LRVQVQKGYTVFNCEQIDGLPSHFYATGLQLDPAQRIAHAEEFVASSKADIRHGGDRAFYAMGPDYVQMPPFEAFRDAASYYATLAHELTHYAAFGIMPRRCDFGRGG